MQDVIAAIKKWQASGQQVALATVTSTWGSAPRQPGAKLALTALAHIAGSVSGGCVESEVVAQGQEALATGIPRLLQFGIADETAWSVGLACGGKLEVFVAPLQPKLMQIVEGWLKTERGGAIATIIEAPDELLGKQLLWHDDVQVEGSLGPELEGAVAALARAALAAGHSQRVELESARGALTLFIDVVLPPLTLLAIGGGHVTVALTRLAAVVGYRTVVLDPRRAFASAERFPHVDRLVTAWPQQALPEMHITPTTAVALLSHDPKIDDPALQLALASDAFYVGALGSRRTHEQRKARLREAGVAAEALERVHAPIGLDLGSQSPEEVALAILAEIVAVWHSRR